MKTIFLAALLLVAPALAQQPDKVTVGVLSDMNGIYSALGGPGAAARTWARRSWRWISRPSG